MNYDGDLFEHELARLEENTADLVAFVERASAAAQDAGLEDIGYDLDSIVDRISDDHHDAALAYAEKMAEEGDSE